MADVTSLPPIIWPAKDPSEVLDYSWQPTLDAGDEITSKSVSKVSGSAVIGTEILANGIITVWLSGGTDGETNIFTLRAITAAGRTFEVTAYLAIVDSANAFAGAFKTAFPAFASTDIGSIAFWYGRAGKVVTTAYGDDQAYASMLLTAHYLTLQGLGEGSEAQRSGKFGGATNVKSGTLSLSWDGGASDGIKSTSYGRLFYPYMRVHGGSPMVTNTGTVAYQNYVFPYGPV